MLSHCTQHLHCRVRRKNRRARWAFRRDRFQAAAQGNWTAEIRPRSTVPQVTFARGLDLSGTLEGAGGIGGLLARYRHGTGSPYMVNGASFYHADGNGNVTYLANSTGGADAAYRYDPFGRWLAGTGPYATANGMRFSSKPWIAHNGSATDGLYSYGYRFYDPYLQRWPNRDPLGDLGFALQKNLLGFDEQHRSRAPFAQTYAIIEEWEGPNLYQFVYNNPGIWVDAYGLYTFGECMDICGAFFSGAGQGLAAAIDGALPFVDPLGSAGVYDPNDPTLKKSQTCGAIASCALGGAGALRGGAALGATRTPVGQWLNHGRYWRLGPGNIPKGRPFTCGPGQQVPTLRIGNWKPDWWNHFDLRAWGY